LTQRPSTQDASSAATRTRPRTALVLAGERPGGNQLARAHDSESSLTLDLNGRAIFDWALRAVEESAIERMILVGPGTDAAAHLQFVPWINKEHVEHVEPGTGPAASAVKGAQAANEWPLLLTAADHALLRGTWIDSFCEQASAYAADNSMDLVIGLVDHEHVKKRFPDSKRTLLRFADGACCGSNLFYLATPAASTALEFWSQLERQRKTPWKIAWGIGVAVCLRYLFGRLAIGDAFSALSRRAGIRIGYCKLDEPELAIDVDSIDDLKLASLVLSERVPGEQQDAQ